MEEHSAEGLPFADAAVDGVGKCYAYQKGEAWLNRVVQTHASPFHVCLVICKHMPEQAMWICVRHGGKVHDLAHHEEHHKAAIGIDGDVALRRLCGRVLGQRHWDCLRISG